MEQITIHGKTVTYDPHKKYILPGGPESVYSDRKVIKDMGEALKRISSDPNRDILVKEMLRRCEPFTVDTNIIMKLLTVRVPSAEVYGKKAKEFINGVKNTAEVLGQLEQIVGEGLS